MKMNKKTNHIDDYFIDGLSDLELSPPADAWGNIEKELNRKRRIRVIPLWSGLAAGLALLIGLGGYYFNNKTQNQYTFAKVNTEKKSSNATQITSNESLVANSRSLKQHSNIEAKNNSDNQNSKFTNNKVVINKSKITKHSAIGNVQPFEYQVNSDSKPIIAYDRNITQTDTISRLAVNEVVLPTESIALPKTMQIASNQLNNTLSDFSDPIIVELPKMRRWSIEVQVAPQYSYRNISNIGTGLPSKSEFNAQEEGLIAYAGGIKVSYETTSRLSFQVGVIYSEIGQTLTNVYSIPSFNGGKNMPSAIGDVASETRYWAGNSLGAISDNRQNNTELNASNITNNTVADYYGLSISENPKSRESTKIRVDGSINQQLKYIEIPFLARYTIIDKRIGFQIVGGISPNVLIGNSVLVKTSNSKENIGETENLSSINYNSNIGLGIFYRILKNTTLTFEPSFKYYINSISTNNDINYHPYSFGLYTGVRYKF